MAEEKVELREINYGQVLPWTELFKGFQLALDPKKLLLAAVGIVIMYVGWIFLSWVFYAPRKAPNFPSDYPLASYQKAGSVSDQEAEIRRKRDYERDLQQWELLDATAGPGGKL